MRTEELDDLEVISAKYHKRDSARPQSAAGGVGSMALRRTIGLTLTAAMAFGVYWVVFHTSIAEPVFALVTPIQDGIDWVMADPKRAWLAAAGVIIPHIGMYYLFFENR